METKILEAKIHNLRFWVRETDPEILKTDFQNLLKQVGFVILNYSDYHFPTQGYTAFWLLAESHLAVHSFPDKAVSYIELSSCNREKAAAFWKLVEKGEMHAIGDTSAIEICEPD